MVTVWILCENFQRKSSQYIDVHVRFDFVNFTINKSWINNFNGNGEQLFLTTRRPTSIHFFSGAYKGVWISGNEYRIRMMWIKIIEWWILHYLYCIWLMIIVMIIGPEYFK